jgi:catechol 2,3-dioxygenase-like lactoylglutathione lyase family enzyme
MPLTAGVNHVALTTEDLERFIDFFVAAFEATVSANLAEGPVRHALIDVGGGMTLHPFQIEGRPADPVDGEMFQRGRLDHVALEVGDEATFEMLRRRLTELGASDGVATDFGMVRTTAFTDPDGGWWEIAHWKSGEPLPLDAATVEQL